MKYSIIIWVYNHLEDTRNCLESIKQYTLLEDIEIIVVSNGSTDWTQEYIRSLWELFILLDFPELLWFARANNEGIKIAKWEYIILLNNDTILLPQEKNLRNWKQNPKNPNKEWWDELCKIIQEKWHHITQIWCKGEQYLVDDVRENLKITEIESLLKECITFIWVDSFLQHLAWYIWKPWIVIWWQSNPLIFWHDIHTNLLKSRDNLRKNQFWLWEQCDYKDNVFVTPKEVLNFIY